jgi:chromate transport protein ChrA
MSLRFLKVVYFATVCLLPPLWILLYLLIFLRRLEVSSEVITALEIYFWLGAVVVLVDLWRSHRERNTKLRWTGLLLLLGIVAFPVYWFRFVLHDRESV